MTNISRFLTLFAFSCAVLTGTAFAQSTSTGAMSSSDHMASGHMTAKQDHMSSHMSDHMSSAGAMSHGHGQASSDAMASGDHMTGSHMKTSSHGKKMAPHHATSGEMTSGH